MERGCIKVSSLFYVDDADRIFRLRDSILKAVERILRLRDRIEKAMDRMLKSRVNS